MNFEDNTYPLPGWLLRVGEVAGGCYEVSLTDRHGRRVELSCLDAELNEKVRECINWAQGVDAADHAAAN